MKRWTGLFLALAAMFLLAGCQPTPETEAVTSKNDGTFQAALQTTAEDSAADEAETETETETAETYTASFTTTDGGTEYTVSLDVPAADTALPVLRVTPEAFSSETVQQATRAVFGDADIYEYSARQTKAEIEAQILSLKQQASDRDALEAEYDEMDLGAAVGIDKQAYVDQRVEQLEQQIAALEAQYEDAPDAVDTALCDFTFHDLSYYDSATLEDVFGYIDYDSDTLADVNGALVAEAKVGELSYLIRAENYRYDDYGDYYLAIELNAVGGEDGYLSLYRGTTEPTQAELDDITAQAEALLASLGLGDWVVDSCSVYHQVFDSVAGYSIEVIASPVYNGLAVTNHLDAVCINENGEGTATADYADESIHLGYIGGTLTALRYYGPLSVVEVTNDNVQILTFDEVMEKVKTNLSLRDVTYYATHVVGFCSFPETGRAEVTIDRAVLGLMRIQVQDSATDYYLVPSYTFYGSVAMFDEDGNQLPYSDGQGESVTGAMETELLTINAVDGTVIDTTLYFN